MKTIWVSRNKNGKFEKIYSAQPKTAEMVFSSGIPNSYIGDSYSDFFGVKPGECRRFLVIPDDDWIPVSSGRVPEDGQLIFETFQGLRGEYRVDVRKYCGFFDSNVVAWYPVFVPEPYKPEVAND